MARNEEKQQGRLNRLWLQKEREEGRLKDARETRPKLYTLNTAASIRKWIPSIKNEIQYYLQQSQLTHYPERKIAEFQIKIEALEKEYKSFITKLRVLDPSCKHQPWTPRAYCKRRADQQDSHDTVKKPHGTFIEENHEFNKATCGGTKYMANLKESTTDTLQNCSESETRTINLVGSNLDCPEQDLPLSFDQSRLAVVVAPYKGSSAALEVTETNNLAKILQSGLPNLGNSVMTYPNLQNLTDNGKKLMESLKTEVCNFSVKEAGKCAVQKQVTGPLQNTSYPADRGGHLLGLDCYSSSNDEDDP